VEAAAASPSRSVVVDRIKPTDSHDALKNVKLVAGVDGSDVKLTATIRRVEVARGNVKLADVVAKLKADAAEYNESAGYDVDAELRALGVRNV
jgi:hypothetical protein